MKQIVPMDLGDGTSILIEIDQPFQDDALDVGLSETVHKARETFAASVEKILPVANVLIKALCQVQPHPKEIEAAFGFNISIESGAIIASSNVGANFGVLLRWSASE
jgi:hypothetical protein